MSLRVFDLQPSLAIIANQAYSAVDDLLFV